MAEIEERSFENFLKLSTKIRAEIIDEMQPDDRCRFTRCSTMCDKEAKISKNYVHSLEFSCYSKDDIRVRVGHGRSEEYDIHGFNLVFEKENGKTLMKYKNRNFETLWEDELESSTDLMQCAIGHYKNFLHSYQNTRRLQFYESIYHNDQKLLKNVDLETETLSNLEELDVCADIDLPQLLSKLQRPLKSLFINQMNDPLLVQCEQIYQVEKELSWWEGEFDFQQFSRITASVVEVQISKLTAKDAFKFIRSWQNGTIGKEIDFYRLHYNNSNVDKQKLWKLLRVKDSEIEQIEINHYNDPGRSAILWYDHDTLDFFMYDERFL